MISLHFVAGGKVCPGASIAAVLRRVPGPSLSQHERQKDNLDENDALNDAPQTKVSLIKKKFIVGEKFSVFCVRNVESEVSWQHPSEGV